MTKFVLPRRRALVLAGGALAAPMIASGIARAADDWPNKPVKYINIFPAGGPTDVLSRIACQKLSELTGQQFIVENKGGSGGNVGADAIAHSAPDGYTLGLMSVSSHAIATTLYSKLPFNADKDFTPVTMLWSLPNLLIVRKSLGPKTVPELIALAKQALDSDDVKKAYLKNGATPYWTSVADTVAYRRTEEARFAPIVKASGAKVD